MTNNSGNSQGLAIDDFSFSANSTLVPPVITFQPQSQTVDSGNNPEFHRQRHERVSGELSMANGRHEHSGSDEFNPLAY